MMVPLYPRKRRFERAGSGTCMQQKGHSACKRLYPRKRRLGARRLGHLLTKLEAADLEHVLEEVLIPKVGVGRAPDERGNQRSLEARGILTRF